MQGTSRSPLFLAILAAALALPATTQTAFAQGCKLVSHPPGCITPSGGCSAGTVSGGKCQYQSTDNSCECVAADTGYSLVVGPLSPNPVPDGGQALAPITIVSRARHDVTLSTSCPAFTNCSTSLNPIATGQTSKLTVTVPSTLGLGTYPVTVQGTDKAGDGPQNGPQTLELTVVPATSGQCSLNPSTNTCSVQGGGSLCASGSGWGQCSPQPAGDLGCICGLPEIQLTLAPFMPASIPANTGGQASASVTLTQPGGSTGFVGNVQFGCSVTDPLNYPANMVTCAISPPAAYMTGAPTLVGAFVTFPPTNSKGLPLTGTYIIHVSASSSSNSVGQLGSVTLANTTGGGSVALLTLLVVTLAWLYVRRVRFQRRGSRTMT